MPPVKDKKAMAAAICDLCREAFQIKATTLYNKIANQEDKYCPPCDKKRVDSMKKEICEDCKKEFRSSEYWFLMKRT